MQSWLAALEPARHTLLEDLLQVYSGQALDHIRQVTGCVNKHEAADCALVFPSQALTHGSHTALCLCQALLFRTMTASVITLFAAAANAASYSMD